MKPIHLIFAIAMGLFVSQNVFASAFKTATVTEVINDVKVLKGAGKPAPAKIKETITSQDIIRTGRDSRTELRFQDNTLARVGANSVFSFAPDKREINLQQGSVLFNSDKGRGGGQIKTAAATAAVTGTTIIVVATANGGFKLLILEGKSRVQLPGGAFVDMQAGQMTFINPGQNTRPEVLTFDLQALISGSKLVEGFSDPLDSMEKVQSAINKQNILIADGKLDETGQLIAFVNEQGEVQIIDMNSLTQILDIDLITELAQQGVSNLPQLDFTALTAAFGTDYLQSTSLINASRTFTDVALLKASPFNSDGFYDHAPNTATYLPANNIDFTTSFIDFAPYQASGTFFFAAEGNITFASTTITLSGPINEVAFISRGDIIFPSNSTINNGTFTNVVNNLSFKAGGSLDLGSGTTLNFGTANVSVKSGGNFVSGSNYIYSASLDITIDGNMTLNGGIYSANSGNLHLGALGNLLVSGSFLSATAGNISIDSNGALIDIYNFATLSANQLNILNTSPSGTISLNNVNLSGPMTSISMQANTINLANIDFPGGSTVNLKSAMGILAPNPNTGAAPINGYVNFINSVTYGGLNATNAVGSQIIISTIP